MNLRAAAVGALSLALMLAVGAGAASPPGPRERESELVSKIAREKNLIKKAKLETKLGRLKMQRAFEAYDEGHFDECWKLLDEYWAQMNDAWSDLVASGRVAAKKPNGFKQLDIALRESRRDLRDFETRVGYEERQAAEKIRIQTENLRARVLMALFPGSVPPKEKDDADAGKPPRSKSSRRPQ